jgi:hypothetical protein
MAEQGFLSAFLNLGRVPQCPTRCPGNVWLVKLAGTPPRPPPGEHRLPITTLHSPSTSCRVSISFAKS